MSHCAYVRQRKKGSETIIRDVGDSIVSYTCQLSASCMCSDKTISESTLHALLAGLLLM
jgi:hypothetical protein